MLRSHLEVSHSLRSGAVEYGSTSRRRRTISGTPKPAGCAPLFSKSISGKSARLMRFCNPPARLGYRTGAWKADQCRRWTHFPSTVITDMPYRHLWGSHRTQVDCKTVTAARPMRLGRHTADTRRQLAGNFPPPRAANLRILTIFAPR